MKNILKLFLLLTAFASPFALQTAANDSDQAKIENEFNQIIMLFNKGNCVPFTTFEEIKEKLNKSSNKKALLNSKNNSCKSTLLHYLIMSELSENIKKQTITLFVTSGADVNASKSDDTLDGITPLVETIRLNNVEIVKSLIENDANVHTTITVKNSEDNYTPLFYAAMNFYSIKDGDYNKNIFDCLLNNGADSARKCIYDGKEQTALQYSIDASSRNRFSSANDQQKNPIHALCPASTNPAPIDHSSSLLTPSKVGIGAVVAITAAGIYYFYKKWQAKKKIDSKKKANQDKLDQAKADQDKIEKELVIV